MFNKNYNILQIGCFVPATEAQFRICDRLFTRIGFGDSIESNASTWVLEVLYEIYIFYEVCILKALKYYYLIL